MYHTILVVGLICLVIMGLNISNQGINRLSSQNNGAVLGLNIDNNTISMYLLGERLSYGTDELTSAKTSLLAAGKELIIRGKSYMSSICSSFLSFVLETNHPSCYIL